MFRTFVNIWKIAELRSRVLITLALLAVYRIGTFIPVPNVDATVLKKIGDNPVFGLLNTFSGGALQNFSIFAMSIYPYITASIIIQLLTMGGIKRFEDWQKEGESGRRKITSVTRYLTVVLGLVQSVGLSLSFGRQAAGLIVNPSFATYALIALTLTAGTAFLMWLGEQITDKGIGNGISILIFASIISRIYKGVETIYTSWFYQHPDQLFINIVKVVILLIGIVLITAGIVFVYEGIRRIPVQYPKRVVGRKMYGGQSTHIPLKVNTAGVIPVIFATSLLFLPAQVASFFVGRPGAHPIAEWFQATFSPGSVTYVILEVFFIIGFTYFYTFVQLNPVQLSDQMKKNGGYIPGIRPGKPTTVYITKIMNRITLAGSLFLAAVAVLPILFLGTTGLSGIYFGGTSLLIVVGVAIETMKQLESQLLQRHYKGFIR
ncbi:preprotein translocase subunit SecY [Fodinisporobacter ferrooxydans]|uniref:Protein translocase subunit SecY n=1 Tax=Fodinisporobacter ferrooxydans TaxID=2901836 RepID=A0ABY4CND3_9BACL|nr:preprotein translocase subunit SecY [Alicyclobacillaceae bacterium MYW30-H2]